MVPTRTVLNDTSLSKKSAVESGKVELIAIAKLGLNNKGEPNVFSYASCVG